MSDLLSGARAILADAERGREWWRGVVIYEDHLLSFRDGNGDGIGDLIGLTEGLDYLAASLGVGAIWVGPCFPSPLLDTGFDVTDYEGIEPIFGDLQAFDRLVAEAHARGVRIIADYIPNHTSDQHPWFQQSRSSRENAKRDWYVWRDGRAPGEPPNNWISEVSGSSWEWDEQTGQYYLHTHLPQQPDLNWRNPEVREAMLGVLRFWLDRGVDGFRIDVAHLLMKDPELRDNPPNPNPEPNPFELQAADYYSQLHVNDRLHPDLHEVLRAINGVLGEYEGDRVAIGEIEALDWPRWAEFYGADLDELHLPFAFQLIETPWEASALAATVAELEAALPAGAWPILALGNHDRVRLASRIGPEQARVAAIALLTLRGSPCLLYGDELGMVDQEVAPERGRDTFVNYGGASHDGTRTPMPWSGAANGGFSTAPEPDLWLPVAAEYEQINVEAQLADPGSILNLYRALLSLRSRSAALSEGTYEPHAASDSHCFCYWRVAGVERKLIALNLSGEQRELAFGIGGRVAISTHRAREGRILSGALSLAANEGVVIEVSAG
ncbi:MAG TPA: alpha-amylase family glycosyl hydrolase [Solirubrobacterales bacterium]|nr:alpha-amylase family glycosyl hydrolase [Solirubrobacterales bacterium]